MGGQAMLLLYGEPHRRQASLRMVHRANNKVEHGRASSDCAECYER